MTPVLVVSRLGGLCQYRKGALKHPHARCKGLRTVKRAMTHDRLFVDALADREVRL